MKSPAILLAIFLLMTIYDVGVYGFRAKKSQSTDASNDAPMWKRDFLEASPMESNSKTDLRKRVEEKFRNDPKDLQENDQAADKRQDGAPIPSEVLDPNDPNLANILGLNRTDKSKI